jgi:hypothetical protein
MSSPQTFICQYCIANINEVDAINDTEYAVTPESKNCTFCLCDEPKPLILLDNNDKNIIRLKKLLAESDREYDYKGNYY